MAVRSSASLIRRTHSSRSWVRLFRRCVMSSVSNAVVSVGGDMSAVVVDMVLALECTMSRAAPRRVRARGVWSDLLDATSVTGVVHQYFYGRHQSRITPGDKRSRRASRCGRSSLQDRPDDGGNDKGGR